MFSQQEIFYSELGGSFWFWLESLYKDIQLSSRPTGIAGATPFHVSKSSLYNLFDNQTPTTSSSSLLTTWTQTNMHFTIVTWKKM